MENIKKIISILLMLLSAVLLAIIIYMSVQLIEMGERAKAHKVDYATLHSVQYGMFNSDVWTQKITNIIDHKIESFDLNINNKNEIKSYIETILDTLVVEAERVVKERNSGKRGFLDSLVGSTKQMITDSIIDFKDLRKRVPEFTSSVMHEVEKPKNQARAKQVLREKLKDFMKNKFKYTTDFTPLNAVLKKYKSPDVTTCTTVLNLKLKTLALQMDTSTNIILILCAVLLAFIVLQGRLSSISLILLSGTSISLLVSGIMLPMLDIEAKISKLSFSILNTPITFENQILFFQSKSISDLVRLLLDSGEAKMIFVGILLVMFSIIFPTLKILSTYLYYYVSNSVGNNPITRFFALRSTKWSMADVMVVSIFMAYLGLDGVVNSELSHLEKKSDSINIITTNGTHLEVGFYLFLGFVLTSFVLSTLVKRAHKEKYGT